MLIVLKEQFDPQGPLELMLVEKIAVAYWRLRRAHRYEVGLIRTNLEMASKSHYAADPFEPDAAKTSDEQLDARISLAEERHQDWQDDKKRFTKMRKAGKDLREIYEWQDNWDFLCDKAAGTVDEVADKSPARVRESLNRAGWTDDAIWQCHLDLCTEQMAQQTRTIRDLQKHKDDNRLALQVRQKICCIPGPHDTDRLLKYEGAIERQFYKAIDQLERLQRLRGGDHVPAPVKIDMAVDAEHPG